MLAAATMNAGRDVRCRPRTVSAIAENVVREAGTSVDCDQRNADLDVDIPDRGR